MYKVMVVDDEPWGRRAVCKMIGELTLDIEVIAEARHGEEALKLIEASRPHIVVTDMNMPVMDGLHFLERLHEHYPDIEVIVISGYSQFDYLKAAITYQACDYLLKPVSMSELSSALVKAAEQCRSYRTLQQREREAEDLLRLRRSSFLQNVTAGRITAPPDIRKQQEDLQLPQLGRGYRLIVIRFRHFSETARTRFHGNADLLMFSIENILHELLPEELALAYKPDDRQHLCLLLSRPAEAGPQGPDWLPLFHQAVQSTLKLELCAGISPVKTDLASLPEAFAEALHAALSTRLHETGCSVILADPDTDDTAFSSPAPLNAFDLQHLRQAAGAANAREVARLLDEYLRKVNDIPGITIRQVQHELERISQTIMPELNITATSRSTDLDSQAISGVLDGSEASRLLQRWIEAVSDHASSRGARDSVEVVRQMTDYLDAHYFEDISLIDVATRFHLDPGYLSKLFKSVTSENFIEYLTRKRIGKACELLRETDRKIGEIAELTGYENQRYFSQVFRKCTGTTPSEYRDHILSKSR